MIKHTHYCYCTTPSSTMLVKDSRLPALVTTFYLSHVTSVKFGTIPLQTAWYNTPMNRLPIALTKNLKKNSKKNKPCQPHQKTTLPILPKTFLNGMVVDCEALKGILKDSKPTVQKALLIQISLGLLFVSRCYYFQPVTLGKVSRLS